ncbi:MAG: sigma-E processing peptidase SpoIIGA [Clostridia bacterium]|nr:sigma-E processing peptidase SpoIIGA [Clostridia bacterium]
MTIYLDIIFLENLFMNFIIIYACEIILKMPIKILRTFFSSMLGSIYAIISYTSTLRIYSSILLKLMLSIAMVYIAFAPKNIKSFLKSIAIFYLTSFTFGGVAFAFLYFVNPSEILMDKRSINRYISNKNNFVRWNFWFYFNNVCI